MFCQQKRREGLAFAEIAQLWRKQKHTESPNKTDPADAKKRRG
jgi:hypothetical protein